MKDTTDFINLTGNMHISNNVVLATLDVSYLYTNIPQTEGIDIICHHYEKRYEHNLPISTNDYGNFYSTHSKRIISNLMKDTSYKHKASLWELRGQLLSLLFLRQTEKNDCQWLGPINLWFGRDLLMISFHCGTFQPKKFTILLTSLTHSTLQISSLLVKYHLNALFFLILRFLRDLAFQLIKYLTCKHISSLLKLFKIHTSHLATVQTAKRVEEKHYVF